MFQRLLQGVHEHHSHIKPCLVGDFAKTGGAGDVDLGEASPDHIQAHRVAMYALTLAAAATFRPDLGPAWNVAKVYWTAFPRSIRLGRFGFTSPARSWIARRRIW